MQVSDVNTERVSLLFLIYSWSYGGAQRQLLGLLRNLDSSKYEVCAVSFYGGGPLERVAQAIGNVRVLSLGKRSNWDLGSWWRLWKLVRRIRPQIIHGYTSVPNLSALFMGKAVRAKVVWGIRDSDYEAAGYSRGTLMRLFYWTYHLLSPQADLTIFGSFAAKDYYQRKGYHFRRATLIPNGLDTEYFRPDKEAGRAMRKVWGISPDAPLIGMVARLGPEKDHPTFILAASILAATNPDVRFVCVGVGSESYTNELRSLAARLGLSNKLVWPATYSEMLPVYNALDLHTLCSLSEGRTCVVAESIACGIPSVVTDVGDAALLAGELGIVVEPRNPEALAAAWQSMLDRIAEGGDALSRALRKRATSELSFELLAAQTEAALADI